MDNDRTIYERALIYHDAGAVAFFGDQLRDIREPLFGGSEFRVSDLTGAVLRAQLKRLPGILRDLRRNRDLFFSPVLLSSQQLCYGIFSTARNIHGYRQIFFLRRMQRNLRGLRGSSLRMTHPW